MHRISKEYPLSVVVWKWGTLYGADHVNQLAAQVRRNLHIPHMFYCLTDRYSQDVYRLDTDLVTPLPMPINHAATPRANRRVQILSREWNYLGPTILQLDLDMVILGDIDSLVLGWDHYVKVVMYWHPGASYNPSFLLMDTGVLDECWKEFDADPEGVFKAAIKAGHSRGCSDQAIINHYLCGPSSTKRSLYDFVAEIMEPSHPDSLNLAAGAPIRAYKRMRPEERTQPLPETRIVLFTGKEAQAVMAARTHPWIEGALR
jgi:hypothetical protein